MTPDLQSIHKDLYQADFVRWVETTLEQLKTQNFAAVDWNNLLEEIADMSRRERQSLQSNLVILLLHLLKWQYQPEHRSGSWRGSIVEHRQRIRQALKDSPSLTPYLREIFAESYADGRERAIAETELAADLFPVDCPYSIEQTLDAEFLPNGYKPD